jgi:hypothetical protein
MIQSDEVVKFIKEGTSLCGICIGSKRTDVESTFERVLNKYGDKKVGYIEIPQGIRFGYWDNLIDELAILTDRPDAIYKSQFADAKIFLESNSIKWTTLGDTNDLSILTEGYVVLIFDNDTGELRMISKTGDTAKIYRNRFD